MAKTAQTAFSDDLRAFIEEWKDKPGNLIMILHRVQQEQGYISNEAIAEVSKITELPLAQVHGVVSFYHFFKTEKPGKNQISVCLGTACYLKGGQDLLDETRRQLALKDGENTSADGLFSVEPVRCIGCCGLAPVVSVNGEVFGKVTTAQVKTILDKFRNKE